MSSRIAPWTLIRLFTAALVGLAVFLPSLLSQTIAAGDYALSLQLDGADDYIEVADTPDLTLNSQFTIEAWVRLNDNSGCGRAIVSKNYLSSYWVGICDLKLTLYMPGNQTRGVTTVPTGVWTHLAVTYSSGGNRSYYINGDLDYTGAAGPAPVDNTSPLAIGINPGNLIDDFNGNIADVRIWNIVRTQAEIRETMHTSVSTSMYGLIANWPLADNFLDYAGGHHGTARGGALLWPVPAPPKPGTVAIDVDFIGNGSQPSVARRGPAAAHALNVNRLILAGGDLGGTPQSSILSLDPSNGVVKQLSGALPSTLVNAGAAYDPVKGLVYIFGGTTPAGATAQILAIDPATGSTRVVGTPLGTAGTPVAVYHAPTQRILVFGGFGTTVYAFDPATETVAATAGGLSSALTNLSAAASSLNGKVYLTGGAVLGSTTIRELTYAGGAVSVRDLTTQLPKATSGLSLVEDPISGQIAILGGSNNRVLLFDPTSEQLSETVISLPEWRQLGTVIYDRANRHALLVGGTAGGIPVTFKNTIWRIPFGDGAVVPVGIWQSLPQAGSEILSIDGDEDHVGIGTRSNGLSFLNGDMTGSVYTDLPGAIRTVRYNAANQRLWAQTNDLVGVWDHGSLPCFPSYYLCFQTYSPGGIDGAWNKFSDLELVPGIANLSPEIKYDRNFEPVFGGWQDTGFSENGPTQTRSALRFFAGPNFFQNPVWETRTTAEAAALVTALRHRPLDSGDLYVVKRRQGNQGEALFYRVNYFSAFRFNTNTGEINYYYGSPCTFGDVFDMAWGPNNDLWMAGQGGNPFSGVGNRGICRVLGLPYSPTYTYVDSGLGILDRPVAYQVSVDKDGRVWIPRGPNSLLPGGGVSVFQSVPQGQELRTGDFNWLNAPVGSLIPYFPPTPPTPPQTGWKSLLTTVGAVDEKVWFGGTDGRAITVAQRWAQLQSTNDLKHKLIDKIFHARGRTFVATADYSGGGVSILQPDGVTWDNRSGIQVRAVLGDSKGRTWMGTSNGVRRYLPTGWDMIDGAVGTAPSGQIRALAEDHTGRIWVGGDNGLTLWDRERWVTTFSTANSTLPSNVIKALLVDNDGKLWVATGAGVSRLDGATFTNFTVANGLFNTDIRDLALYQGRVVVSTTAGQVVFNGTSFVAEAYVPGAPLDVDDKGQLWAGRYMKQGTGVYQGYFETNSGLSSLQISDVASDHAGRVWFAHGPDVGVSVRGSYLAKLPEVIPTVDSITPDGARWLDTVTINGTGFGSNIEDVEIRIGGTQLPIQTVSPNQITARITADVTSGDVTVRRGRRSSSLLVPNRPSFCVGPTLSTYTPTGGSAGVEVRLTGFNFDPSVEVALGGAYRRVFGKTRELQAMILATDADGTVRVKNSTPGCPGFESTNGGFNKVDVRVRFPVQINQGLSGLPLITGKPSILRHYLTTDGSRRTAAGTTDTVEIDSIEATYKNLTTGAVHVSSRIPVSATIPFIEGAVVNESEQPVPSVIKDLTNSLNIATRVLGGGSGQYRMQVDTKLFRRGQLVANGSNTFDAIPGGTRYVFVAPVVPSGTSPAVAAKLVSDLISNSANFQERMMPFGRLEIVYTPGFMIVNDGSLDAGTGTDDQKLEAQARLVGIAQQLDRERNYRARYFAPIDFMMGILHPNLAVPGAAGFSWTPQNIDDIEESLNNTETLCDIANAAAEVLTLSLADFDDCHTTVPRLFAFTSTVTGSRVSEVLMHELGHAIGLVPTGDPRYATDLPGAGSGNHSRNDELTAGGSVLSPVPLPPGVAFDPELTLYASTRRGLEPIVNPLDPITQAQILPNLGISTTPAITRAQDFRAKGVMAYAFNRVDDNVFYEPEDVAFWNRTYLVPGRAGAAEVSATGVERVAKAVVSPKNIPNDRIAVNGVINGNSGSISSVRNLGPNAPVGMIFDSDWAIAQVDGNGAILNRQGVALFAPHIHGILGPGSGPTPFYATLLKVAGATGIRLLHGNDIVASFAPGPNAPTVSISSPNGESFATGSLPVTWTATDADGDPLEVSVEYSRDAGATWKYIGSGAAAATLNVPVAELGGSTDARVRVTASDGLLTGSAVSAAFTVGNAPPQAYLLSPSGGAQLLERASVLLVGKGTDPQSGPVDASNLYWFSGRDGFLGTGDSLSTQLSAGTHVLTLRAFNAAGQYGEATVTVFVQPDYDGDGIGDAAEMSMGLSVLNERDAFNQTGGLPLILKLKQGLNPASTDSDGDGRSDADELAARTNPAYPDLPLPANALAVAPASVTRNYNLASRQNLPQQVFMISSVLPAGWTVTADVPWLIASKSSGRTFDSITVAANPAGLAVGANAGNLTFTSPDIGGSVVIPFTVNVTSEPVRGNKVIFLPASSVNYEGGW